LQTTPIKEAGKKHISGNKIRTTLIKNQLRSDFFIDRVNVDFMYVGALSG